MSSSDQFAYGGWPRPGIAGPAGAIGAWAVQFFIAAALALYLTVLFHDNAQAQAAVEVRASEEAGFARIVLMFPDIPDVEVKATTGVVVMTFADPAQVDVNKIAGNLPNYIGASRADPDRKGIRLALRQPFDVNVMEAGESIVIDLLPKTWTGLPPGLPDDIVEDLAERARDAEARRERRERAERIASAEQIPVRVAKLPTFVRVVFEWPEPTEARLTRDGTDVTVEFENAAKINVSEIRPFLPEWVLEVASAFHEKGGLQVTMNVDSQVNVRGFPEGNTYVLDITNPEWADTSNPLRTDSDVPETGRLDVAGSEERAVAELPQPVAEAPVVAERQSFDPAESDVQQIGERDTPPVQGDDGIAMLVDRALDDVSGEQPIAEDNNAASRSDEGSEEPAEQGADVAVMSSVGIVPRVRKSGSLTKITFPFETPTAAAIFERYGSLWFVFDGNIPIDATVLRRDLVQIVSAIDADASNDRQVLRLKMRAPMLISSELEQTDWVITLGDMVLAPPKPIVSERAVSELGDPIVEFAFPTLTRVHELADPETGNQIFAAAGFGPARAVFKRLEHVDFVVEPTLHGIVVQSLVDDLEVKADNGTLRVMRPGGLVLSQQGGQSYEVASGALGDKQRPGFVTIENEEIGDEGGIAALVTRTQRAIAELPEERRSAGRLRLARLYLAADLAPEAIGMLRYIEAEDANIANEPTFRALHGVGLVLMGRSEEALRTFDDFRLGDSADISLWRGMAHTELADWREAGLEFAKGEAAIAGYTSRRQMQFRLAAARAALQVGDLEAASRHVGAGEVLAGSIESNPELLLLWGWLNERLGRDDQAAIAYAKVMEAGDRRLEAEATLRDVHLKIAARDAKRSEAIDRLETLAIVWRGGPIELSTLQLLARLQAKEGNYRRAFEVMKTASISGPDSPITRAIESEMSDIFANLFIAGRASGMEPIDALALYYDFREMTPIGRRGDEMIRALADRLIDVDLLGQAAQLLTHQVDNRLSGAARAQIAAKLALVHLMNRKPELALEVLSRTRQAVLPEDVKKQRTVLEARALSETGRANLAVDLLSTVEGPEVGRLMADALWRAESWQDAGEAFERVVGNPPAQGETLADDVRLDILRAAIAYSLAGDNLGLGRIRQKFAAAMARSPDANTFEVVSGGVPEATGDFREVVKAVAATDTLAAFLSDYQQRFDTLPEGTPAS